MKRHLTIIILVLCAGLLSCSSDNNKSKDAVSVPFRQFLKKFRPLQYPLTFRTKLGTEKFNYSLLSVNIPTPEELKGLSEFDEKSIDSLFIKDLGKQTIYYGMLPDTNNYFGLIFILNGAEGTPIILRTYDKIGKQMSETNLLYCGDCHAGTNLEWCSSTGIINNNGTIHCVDSIKTVKRDSNMNIIDGTGDFYLTKRDGKINLDGKISMTKEQRINLK